MTLRIRAINRFHVGLNTENQIQGGNLPLSSGVRREPPMMAQGCFLLTLIRDSGQYVGIQGNFRNGEVSSTFGGLYEGRQQ